MYHTGLSRLIYISRLVPKSMEGVTVQIWDSKLPKNVVVNLFTIMKHVHHSLNMP